MLGHHLKQMTASLLLLRANDYQTDYILDLAADGRGTYLLHLARKICTSKLHTNGQIDLGWAISLASSQCLKADHR